MTGGASTDPADPGQTEVTPTTVPISPVGATPGFGPCAGQLSFAEDLSATEEMEGSRVRGHLQTRITIPQEEVHLVLSENIRIHLPSGEEVITSTDSGGCFDVSLAARAGDKIYVTARRTDCDEEAEARLVVSPGRSTEPPCGVNALPRVSDPSSGVQEIAAPGPKTLSNPKIR